jgi:hypothetical protein
MSTVTRYIAEFEMPTVPSGPIAGWVVDFNVSLFVGTVGRLGGEGIDRHTGVWATITEVQQPPGQRFDFPFIGSANMSVLNVAPLDDGTVLLRVACIWPRALHCQIQLLVSND